jgi:hypothetical protein
MNKGTHNPLQQVRQTVILDDEDDFDPDAAIRAEGGRFGEPDMYAYVDQGAASENIKALLEGAFDEENEKIPRTRLRKKKKQQEDDAGMFSGLSQYMYASLTLTRKFPCRPTPSACSQGRREEIRG